MKKYQIKEQTAFSEISKEQLKKIRGGAVGGGFKVGRIGTE